MISLCKACVINEVIHTSVLGGGDVFIDPPLQVRKLRRGGGAIQLLNLVFLATAVSGPVFSLSKGEKDHTG